MSNKPVIGVSGCLMGQKVRFDGGHKRDRFITDILDEHMEIRTFCPEIGIGLGTPRPTIRLQEVNNEIRLVSSKDINVDYTAEMTSYSKQTVQGMSHLDGFIFKKGSPSCGAYRVPVVVHKDGHRRHDAAGLFAKEFMKTYPWIPVEEEGRLNDTMLRENFIERVYALQRWHSIDNPDTNLQDFINFHATHKLMLMARSPVEYQKLGQWVANTTYNNLAERRQQYLEQFMQAMTKPVSKGKHVNVLMHILGYLKKKLSATDKQELLGHLDAYRKNRLPLISLIILMKHHLQNHPVNYIYNQHYLTPYPSELGLSA